MYLGPRFGLAANQGNDIFKSTLLPWPLWTAIAMRYAIAIILLLLTCITRSRRKNAYVE